MEPLLVCGAPSILSRNFCVFDASRWICPGFLRFGITTQKNGVLLLSFGANRLRLGGVVNFCVSVTGRIEREELRIVWLGMEGARGWGIQADNTGKRCYVWNLGIDKNTTFDMRPTAVNNSKPISPSPCKNFWPSFLRIRALAPTMAICCRAGQEQKQAKHGLHYQITAEQIPLQR